MIFFFNLTRSREIASLWNVFLNLKLFLLVSTAETYKQQYLIQTLPPRDQKCPTHTILQPTTTRWTQQFAFTPSVHIVPFYELYRFCPAPSSHTSEGDPRRKPQQMSCNPKSRQISWGPDIDTTGFAAGIWREGPISACGPLPLPPTNLTTRLGFPLCGLWAAFAPTTNTTCCQNDHFSFHQLNTETL